MPRNWRAGRKSTRPTALFVTAPPLDGSAHAWHHPQAALKMTIREGTTRLGGSMPVWKDKLSDRDIDAVIVWMQSL